ncbi:RNA polymerase sigma factor [Sphingomonas jatrophae]|uniref:RNA polymerase sigma-70 factor, ECF subfamily n=1 Tax=Sphingomonas jatrophae TaxID=1166337 RepID=A0A1I6JXW0_9SPHN|nr:sigma-70 family RNA polymerase sigma factor [Sphingomonas jatrophae]SFR83781.1 RNA polymerase sigma-70 factor, ECF subfamily [Sphingomonas jatrophae]
MSGLEAIFLSHRDALLRFLRAHGAGDAAEDVLHELWLKLQAAQTGPIASPTGYLYRAANNLMLDRYRAERQSSLRDRAWSEAAGPVVPDRSEDPSPERALIARETLAAADAALATVGERAARIFRRHRIDNVAQKAIAAEMGLSLSTVEADLRKAMRALIDARRRIDEA